MRLAPTNVFRRFPKCKLLEMMNHLSESFLVGLSISLAGDGQCVNVSILCDENNWRQSMLLKERKERKRTKNGMISWAVQLTKTRSSNENQTGRQNENHSFLFAHSLK